MRKITACILMVIMFVVCRGQNNDQYRMIYQHLQALDSVHPLPYKKTTPKGVQFVIEVKNQQQFDDINDMIIKAVEAGHKNVMVRIRRGTYQFRENHIFL